MYRLQKGGLIREVETSAEADYLTSAGYGMLPELVSEVLLDAEQQLRTELLGYTIAQLVEVCKEKNIEMPKGTKKKEDFVQLILDYTFRSEE